MNTLHLRIFAGLLAAALLRASVFAEGGPPPDLLRWHHYAEPVFPLQLTNTQVIDGFANVVFTFDDEGYVTDRVVTAASHPAFTVAVMEATQSWRIDTRTLAAHLRRETLRFNFHRDGAVITLTHREAIKTAFTAYGDFGATALSTCRETDLERPLQLSTSASAEYPPELKSRGVRGRATLSFIVDAAGRVRVPAVTDATDPAFGAAALTALRQWNFAPTVQGGIPVLVIAERTFVFGTPTGK